MNYSSLYAIKAQRAVETGLIDIGSIIEELRNSGVPPAQINTMLVNDLETEGPIFGKFFRSLGMAGETSISVAESQASGVAESMTLDEEIARFARETSVAGTGLGALIEQGDPQALQIIEDESALQDLTWICTLRNTCEQCLPLHGKTMKRYEWNEMGLRPRAIHPRCECDWMPEEKAADSDDLQAPLTRQVAPGQEKGGRKTVRAITQPDVERAIAAAQKASESKTGRKMLQLLGRSKG